MSGLNITHVHRNLHTRVTFLYLEFEDAFVIERGFINFAAFDPPCSPAFPRRETDETFFNDMTTGRRGLYATRSPPCHAF